MQFLRTHKKEILISLLIIAAYFLTRFLFLSHLPIFTDEAIYIRWAQIAKQDAAERFISLTDGKQPMFIWIMAAIMKVVKDPILAGRTTSVFAGLFTTIGLFFLGKEIFKNKWIGFLSAGIYVLYPFGLVYDRLAIYDSLVGTCAIWGLFVEVLLIRRIQSYLAYVVGLVVGFGVLTKTNAFFNIYFLPLTAILFDFRAPKRIERFKKWMIYAVIATVLVYAYYSILRLSPNFGIIVEKDHTFIYPFSEWMHHPLTFFVGNLQGLTNWFVTYFQIPGILLVILSFFILPKYWREKLLLFVWGFFPFIALALFGKVIYPRYILPMTLTLIPLVAVSLYWLLMKFKKQYIGIVAAIIFAAVYLWMDYFIIFHFAYAPIPQSDLGQFINSWPSGGGVKESIQFFQQQAQNQKIYIATQGTYGLMPEAYEMYLITNPNITIKGYWPIHDTFPSDVASISARMPTYFVFYQPCPSCTNIDEAPSGWPVKKILSYQRGTGNNNLTVYQVLPKK